jgi:putative Holliday junction resolvase
MRILAIDPGDKRIGLALSDPTQTIANPLTVIIYESRVKNAAKIVALATEHACSKIIIGAALHWDNSESEASLKANKLADEIRSQSDIPVEMWDEYGSTQKAKASRKEMGKPVGFQLEPL